MLGFLFGFNAGYAIQSTPGGTPFVSRYGKQSEESGPMESQGHRESEGAPLRSASRSRHRSSSFACVGAMMEVCC